MYKVYLKTINQFGFSEVDPASRTNTKSFGAAQLAFKELIKENPHLNGTNAAVVMSFRGRQVAYHRFDRYPGDVDYVGENGIIQPPTT